MNSRLSFVSHLFHGVIVKTPHARASQKVRGSLTWWWHSFFILCFTITLLPSLMRIFLSLIEDLTIDFPSHFILSLIDVYRDTATVISLSFLLLSRGSFAIPLFLISILLISLSCVPLVRHLFNRVRHNFDRSGHRPRRQFLQLILLCPSPLLLLFLWVVWR